MTSRARFRVAACCALLTGMLLVGVPAATEGFSPTIRLRGRTFVEQLHQGAFKKATRHFDATMTKALPPARLATIWRGLEQKLGPFQRLGNVRTESARGYRFVFVTCEFARDAIDAKVVFSPDGTITGLFFVPVRSRVTWSTPTYAKPGAFTEVAVTVGRPPWRLPGTVSLPQGTGPFPGVVLVHGSGPNNRDEQVGGIRVFKDLAWGLASQGIAVLRYDKRTLVHGQRMAGTVRRLTVKEETIDDAVAAAAFLQRYPKVEGKRVFVLGHSLGGLVAPRIAQQARRLAGIIILAGNTRPTPELVVEQVTYLAKLDGLVDQDERAEIDRAKKFRRAALSKRLRPGSELELFGAKTYGRYWLDLRQHRPTKVAATLRIPMFIAQGQRDYQVTVKDFAGWKAALRGQQGVVFRLYPKLNHLFVAGTGQSTPAEYQQAGHVDEQVIRDLARWVQQH